MPAEAPPACDLSSACPHPLARPVTLVLDNSCSMRGERVGLWDHDRDDLDDDGLADAAPGTRRPGDPRPPQRRRRRRPPRRARRPRPRRRHRPVPPRRRRGRPRRRPAGRRRRLTTCTVQLDFAFDPALHEVYGVHVSDIGGEASLDLPPQEVADCATETGWRFADPARTRIELCGAACALVRGPGDVYVGLGCVDG